LAIQRGQEHEGMSKKTGMIVLVVCTILVAGIACFLPRIPQPLSYHLFADGRGYLGIPNFGDVVSNLPFAIFGVWGIVFLLRLRGQEFHERFLDRRERLPYLIFFVGMLLTAFGSSYYHLHPDNARLVWDRIPMTIAFMSLISALIAERINLRAGIWLLPFLLLIGMGSVLQWYGTELQGVGDLRFYGAIQAYSVVFLLIMLCFPPRYTRGSDLLVVAGFYVLAKLLETFDRQIFDLGHVVSGHTLKHLVAAMAGYWVLRMLMRRRPVSVDAGSRFA
jgi:hypothetical protein